MIPYGRQSIDQSDIDAVVAVLTSDYLTQGPAVPRFERAVAAAAVATHAVAVSSATAALHLACKALGVGPGDRVWTSAITFVASSNCALYCGADVDFIDIDPATYNMSVAALSERLVEAKRSGRLPKVVIPVHLAGQSCDMRAIHALSQEFGFRIVEDASHAIGASYLDEPVGSCRYSDITVFSFHPVKIVTTAEGGVAVTHDAELAARMDLLRSHGITRDPALMVSQPHGGWYYEQIALGFHYRMTELQAALGASQMTRLHEFVARRRALAARYDQLLADLPVVLPCQDPTTSSSWHLYVLRLQRPEHIERHAEIFARLREMGIGVNLHYIPVYTQPYYRQLGFEPGHCPEAEKYYSSAISIPLYADLGEADQDEVVRALTSCLAAV